MEALGQLAGGVAHDFNNILTGILGFSDVIQHTTEDRRVQGFTGEILQAARRAKDLVRQILMFSRRQPPVRKPVRLAEIAREAVRLLQGWAPPAVAIEIVTPAEDVYTLGDATQLHQVVTNLGTNAVQAMGETGGTLSVAVEVVEVDAEFARRHPPLHPRDALRLTVGDTGPGMPQAVIDRLFEPFFTTKAPGAGTGLGLSVVHGIVQTHDGAIVLHSLPGRGTTFEIYLPIVGAPSWPGEMSVTTKPTPGEGKRILFVDDEASIIRLAQVMLKTLGHTVTTYGDPQAGLAALTANPTAFDLLVTDLTMPGMTGVELARGIRAIRTDMPIILSSGYADKVPDETLRELGIVEVLPKPFQMQAMGEAIRRATRKDEAVE
jgi:CheY-like chemotaxis protein/two-component sensor histidine kinase